MVKKKFNPLPFEVQVQPEVNNLLNPNDFIEIIRQGKLIVQGQHNDGSSGFEEIIYQVPAGKKFILTSLYAQMYNAAGTLSSFRVIIDANDTQKLIKIDGTGALNQDDIMVQNFSIPLVFNQYQTISLKCGIHASGCAYITGYEIEKL
jgi:hypothetical protein